MIKKAETAQKVISRNNGIAKTSQFVDYGLTTYDVKILCKKNYIAKVRHGVYKFSNAQNITDEKLIKTVLPEVVVCLESALFYYGYSDFIPRKWNIAVPRSISLKKIKSINIDFTVFYLPPEKLYLGKTTAFFNGTELFVYDRDKTICDCFKYRNKMDSEIFNKAVKAYAKDDKKNLSNLVKYAKEMKVYKKVMDIMGVLLND